MLRLSLALMPLLLTLGLAAVPAASVPVTIDFETDDGGAPLSNGQMITTPPEFGNLLNISTVGSELGVLHQGPTIFDSDSAGPNAGGPDPDLLVDLGNILILQCVDGVGGCPDGTSTGDFFDEPNDQRVGGTVIFDFSPVTSVSVLSLDLVDINGGAQTDVVLTDINGNTRTYDVPSKWTLDINTCGACDGYDTLDLTTLAPQNGEGTGGDATASEDAGFDGSQVVEIRVIHSGSAGLDNLVFDTNVPPAPEPGTALLLLAPLGALLARRRRR